MMHLCALCDGCESFKHVSSPHSLWQMLKPPRSLRSPLALKRPRPQYVQRAELALCFQSTLASGGLIFINGKKQEITWIALEFWPLAAYSVRMLCTEGRKTSAHRRISIRGPVAARYSFHVRKNLVLNVQSMFPFCWTIKCMIGWWGAPPPSFSI